MTNFEKWQSYSDQGLDKLVPLKELMDKAPKGVFLEVGTRRGGTALMAMECPNSELVVCVDPYIGFNDMAGRPIEMNSLWFSEAFDLLTKEMLLHTKQFLFYKMTSENYISLGGSQEEYAYVFLDGAHVDDIVRKEIEYFTPRMQKGGILVVDNVDWLTLDFTGWEKPRYDQAYKIF